MKHKPDAASLQMIESALRMIKHPNCTEAAARDALLGVYQLGVTDGKMFAFDASARAYEGLLADIPMGDQR